jgi:hypothetical protein
VSNLKKEIPITNTFEQNGGKNNAKDARRRIVHCAMIANLHMSEEEEIKAIIRDLGKKRLILATLACRKRVIGCRPKWHPFCLFCSDLSVRLDRRIHFKKKDTMQIQSDFLIVCVILSAWKSKQVARQVLEIGLQNTHHMTNVLVITKLERFCK